MVQHPRGAIRRFARGGAGGAGSAVPALCGTHIHRVLPSRQACGHACTWLVEQQQPGCQRHRKEQQQYPDSDHAAPSLATAFDGGGDASQNAAASDPAATGSERSPGGSARCQTTAPQPAGGCRHATPRAWASSGAHPSRRCTGARAPTVASSPAPARGAGVHPCIGVGGCTGVGHRDARCARRSRTGIRAGSACRAGTGRVVARNAGGNAVRADRAGP